MFAIIISVNKNYLSQGFFMKKYIIFLASLISTQGIFSMDQSSLDHNQRWHEEYVIRRTGQFFLQQQNPGVVSSDGHTHKQPQFPFGIQKLYASNLEEVFPANPQKASIKDYVQVNLSWEDAVKQSLESDWLSDFDKQIERAAIGHTQEPALEHFIRYRNKYNRDAANILQQKKVIHNFYEDQTLTYDPSGQIPSRECGFIVGPVLKFKDNTYPLSTPIKNSEGRTDLSRVEGIRLEVYLQELKKENTNIQEGAKYQEIALKANKEFTPSLVVYSALLGGAFTGILTACYFKFFGK
jgi:hypothetical protein